MIMVNDMDRVLSYLKRDNLFLKWTYYLLGLFVASFIYNAIFVPNNIVTGGVSGLAIIIKKLTGLSTTIFIDISNIVLVIVSFIFLGKRETFKQLAGCILYPLMVTITGPLAELIADNFPSSLLTFIVASLIYGFANGIIYRTGYSTGGADIIIQIISNKVKASITQISPILNITIIVLGGIVFSPIQIMYAITIIFISNRITNAILYSIKTSKMVYVISKKNRDIEDYIMNDIHAGATEMRVHSGLFESKKQMLMCILHNSQYPQFKHDILKMDREAFILAKNCYEVSGGIRYTILPF